MIVSASDLSNNKKCSMYYSRRLHAYVFNADIEKIYRQILVHPDDRRYQRILWSVRRTPAEFQLNTVIYGLVCAPYLALRVLRQFAYDDGKHYPKAAKILHNEMSMTFSLAQTPTPASPY